MTQLNKLERKMFLKFVTGTSRLPTGGFKHLDPKMIVVLKKDCIKGADLNSGFLPSVMT